MAYTSSATISVVIVLDAVARATAVKQVAIVAEGYKPPPRPPYVGPTPPLVETVDEAYVLTGAARIGLNLFCLPGSPVPKSSVFEPKAPPGAAAVAVDILLDDEHRASALGDHIGVPVADILSCAVATGLAMLAGDHALRGPFEVS